MGIAELPFDIPVEIETIVEIAEAIWALGPLATMLTGGRRVDVP